jgi:hypothetical protein
MPGSTGPILAIGAITMVNESVVNGQPVDWRVPIATGLAALAFGGLENGIPAFSDAFTKLAWLALVTTLIVRLKPNTPAPLESFVDWYNKK